MQENKMKTKTKTIVKKNDGHDFPVELSKIATLPGSEVKGKRAVVRTDTGDVLGIVSDKYQIVKHSEVIGSFRKLLKGINYSEKIKMMNNGAHMFAQFKIDDTKIEVQKGDIVSLQFVVKNSYDGTNSLQIMLGAFRLVCSNGMTIGKTLVGYSKRHIGQEMGIDSDALANSLKDMTSQFKNALPAIQKMTKSNMKGELIDHFLTSAIKLPGYLLDEAMSEYKRAGDMTIWGYYNSLTYAITHKMRLENPKRSLRYGKIAWNAANSLI